MTDPDLVSRLRHGAANIHSIGPVWAAALLNEAAGALVKLQPLEVRQPEARALFQPVFDPLATGHPMNSIPAPNHPGVDKDAPRGEVKRFRYIEVGNVRFENVEIEQGPLQHGRPFDPAEFGELRREPNRLDDVIGLDVPDSTMAPKGARLEVVGGDPETIRALGLPEPINQLRTRRLYSTPPEGPLAPIDLVVLPPAPAPAKPLVSIVLPALRFEDKRITSSNTLSVLCGDREVWTGNGTCELDIRTTVVENQISYAHPLTFDGMMEAKGTIWLQANDEAAALLRTFKGSSVRLVLRLTGGESTVTASLCDLPDGHEAPSAVGWAGFGIVVEGK